MQNFDILIKVARLDMLTRGGGGGSKGFINKWRHTKDVKRYLLLLCPTSGNQNKSMGNALSLKVEGIRFLVTKNLIKMRFRETFYNRKCPEFLIIFSRY